MFGPAKDIKEIQVGQTQDGNSTCCQSCRLLIETFLRNFMLLLFLAMHCRVFLRLQLRSGRM